VQNLMNVGQTHLDYSVFSLPLVVFHMAYILLRNNFLQLRLYARKKEMTHVARIVLAHHENWDGNGYPGKLSGDAIAIQSCVIRIVDSYDAMTRLEPCRPAMTSKEPLDEILFGAGTLCDPNLVPIIIGMFR
jgi:response regulator RpfG family c-di-GMP phosphodiesterase